MIIDPKEVHFSKVHKHMLGAVSPRPIAFASTIDKAGNVNLAPYSFFNAFSANPPILVFSPARSGRTNTTKHTYDNVKEHPEVVINMVSYSMVQQMSLASSEYPKEVNEFVKAGFTEEPSQMVKPPRVKESPVQIECKVRDVIELGPDGGAGNLVIAEILLMHINDDILDENGLIDPQKIDLVGRMGGAYYVRANGDKVFELPKPFSVLGIGVDSLPEHVRNSNILTGNDLGKLGNLSEFPEAKPTGATDIETLHKQAKELIAEGRVEDALSVLLSV